MKRAPLAAAAIAIAACAQKHDSKPAGSDPWSTPPAAAATPAKSDPTGLPGGGDLPQMLQNVVANLDKPGPYEAPKASSGYEAGQPHWGVMTLSGQVAELEGFSWTSGVSGLELRGLRDRLRTLAADDKLTGLLVRVEDLDISLPDAEELRASLARFKEAGKKLVCHTEGARNVGYLVLTACDRIGLAPLGDVVLTGPVAMPIHLKKLLDKVGVKADFLHVGAYKGAAEPLTRDAPSAEMRETLGAVLDRAYASIVDGIATGRKLSPEQVKAMIDRALFPADAARDAKLVDAVAPFEQFRADELAEAEWTTIELDTKDDAMASMMKVAQFLGAMPRPRPTQPHVALVYAVGGVVDGSGEGILGARQEIASRTLVPALRALAADPAVKAVVLRIDSGGGSALASELIWTAVAELKAKKPVVVSMSDVAASGGYYIACAATRIFALEDTLTGSIGVVGGKLALSGALDKLGVAAFPIGRGKRATLYSSFAPWTADERAAVQASMEAVYEKFLERVSAGRLKTRDQIHAIAQGRVWTGAKAKELGLVDEIGGLDAALAAAEKLGGVAGDAGIEIYPPTPTLRDIIHGIGAVSLPFGLDGMVARIGHELSPAAAAAVDLTLRQLLTFRDAPVQTVALLPIVLR